MMFVYNYIYDPPLFRQCDVTDNAVVEDSHVLDGCFQVKSAPREDGPYGVGP